ncbi:alpha/beta fold hydrolase [Phytohabitans kaempferiae]|uniref:Alpha/beta fold hydrolase n=1 Tax=Phytohabitans kaempferiae TaxID=1620943 RepID=A0ABV6MC59_9ACTN
MRRLGGAVLVLAALPVGVVAGLVVLLAAAALTGSRVAAVLLAVLATATGAAALALPAARLLTPGQPPPHRARRWTTVGVTGAVTSVFLALAAVLVLPSGSSNVLTEPPGVRHWQLPTGSRLAYVHTPAQAAPRDAPVVIVHGGPGAPELGDPGLTARLAAAGYDVYAYHQFGAGLSSRATDIAEYTVARHVADLDAVRAAIGVERLTLVGASWGAQLIANYLAAHPERVARAVLTSPGTIWSPAFPSSTQLTPAGRRDQQDVVDTHPRFMIAHVVLAVAGPRAARTLLPERGMDAEYEALVGGLDMRPGCAGPGGADDAGTEPAGFGFWANAMTVRDAGQAPDPRPALRGLETPVLVLRGECDYIAPAVAAEYGQLLPNTTLVDVPDAGHDIARDQPRVYHERITRFLSD